MKVSLLARGLSGVVSRSRARCSCRTYVHLVHTLWLSDKAMDRGDLVHERRHAVVCVQGAILERKARSPHRPSSRNEADRHQSVGCGIGEKSGIAPEGRLGTMIAQTAARCLGEESKLPQHVPVNRGANRFVAREKIFGLERAPQMVRKGVDFLGRGYYIGE